jgi:DnaK suppressor protein
MVKKMDKKNVNLNLLRSRLESEQKRLTDELEQLKSSVRPAEERREGSPFGKREEEATESFELERRLTLEKRIMEQLAGVEHALQKFEDGTYGLCDNCGQPIDPARLEALPQASLCLDCKARQAKEAKGK